MNSQVKEKWVNALRSGEYSQGTGKLRSTEGFCCLGVLCDLYSKENSYEWDYRGYTDDPENQPTDYWYFDGESEFLPLVVQDWAGLSTKFPEVKVVDEYSNYTALEVCVAELNDIGYSFEQLSELIEESL